MGTHTPVANRRSDPAGAEARAQLVGAISVVDRRLRLAGVSTALLEGGEGPPVVLLHGPGGNATHWMRAVPDLLRSYRVVAPDLPGQGASMLEEEAPKAGIVLAWLEELIARTCPGPPTLVGYALGGAIAARFAVERGARLRRLVLVDALGLVPFRPAPEFGAALAAFLAHPDEATHEALWRRCAHDLDALRADMAERWDPFVAYNLDRIRTPSVARALEALMGEFGVEAIPATDLAKIAVPVSLIWGRHDLATPLAAAAAISARHGWPLHVIEDAADDPPVERPARLVEALRAILRD